MSEITVSRELSGAYKIFCDGRCIGSAWKHLSSGSWGVSFEGVYWQKDVPSKLSGMSSKRVKRLRDVYGLAQNLIQSGFLKDSQPHVSEQKAIDPTKVVLNTIASMYRGEITSEQATVMLSRQCSPEQLAELYVDAFNRGWISRFNLGIDEDGNVI